MTIYEHTVPTVFLVLVVIAAVALGGFSTWRFIPRKWINLLLPGLHLVLVGLFAWCLLMPGRKDAVTRLLKPRFVVALDTSASMTLTPGEQVPSRWDTARRVLEQPWVTLVGAECEIDVIPFNNEVSQKTSPAEAADLQPEGSATQLRDGLKQITERYTGLNVAGALLLSDGIDTREAFDDWAAEARPFPVHTVRLQPDEVWQEEADLRIDGVHTPRRVTVDWKAEFKVMVAGQGTGGQPVTVQLYRNEVLLKDKPVAIPAEGGEREIVFEIDHPEVGTFNFRVQAVPLPEEKNTGDNTYEVTVQVSDAKNRLLYVEGVPRWEYKFLKRALLANKQATPVIFYTGYDGKPRGGTPVGKMTTEMTESQLAYFKIVVLGNLDAGEIKEAQAQNLQRFVENGGSLVILGGRKAWGPGGFAQTALGRIMPVRTTGAQTIEAATPFPVALTDTARSHPAFAGDPELWVNMPPVLSLFQGVQPLPAAQVLVQARTPEGEQPLVVSHRVGQGKVTAIFTDSLWKWQLSPEGAETKPYQRFWTQLISWLLPKEEDLGAGRIDLAADRDRLFLGEQVEIAARTGDRGEGEMRSLVILPDGREVPFAMTPDPAAAGQDYAGFILNFTGDTPGLHKVHAVWKSEGSTRESDPISFFVKAFSPESVPRPINRSVLQTVSASSGGVFHETLDDLDQALSALQTRAIEEQSAEYRTLWRTTPMIVGLMLLLTISWTTRKLRNMP